MKFIKYILPAMAAVGMLAACSDEPTGESTKRPAGSGDEPEQPEEPSNPSDVVSPEPDFSLSTQKISVDLSKKL